MDTMAGDSKMVARGGREERRQVMSARHEMRENGRFAPVHAARDVAVTREEVLRAKPECVDNVREAF